MQTPSDSGPDLTLGVTLADFGDRQMLRGYVGKKSVLLVRLGDDILAVGAKCTHYQGPLEQGLIEGDTIRCPLHHACFSLRSGEALAAPAFDPLPCWQVEREDGRILVRERIPATTPESAPRRAASLREIVIIGGGAAGLAAAEMLRRRGHDGPLRLISAEADPPCDRPNLSKDFLAGKAPESWLPLRSEGFYSDNGIDLLLQTSARAIDRAARRVVLSDGRALPFDRLLIATGAEPLRPRIPGADLPHVFTLRSLADSRALAAAAAAASSAVVLGSGFIGLEAAAALRQRGIEVRIVSHGRLPLERVLGAELGGFIRSLHEAHGVRFHMEDSIAAIAPDAVTLGSGGRVAADLVILGVGVVPRVALAEAAGLDCDRGILVDARLRTSQPGIYAAGDVARWPGGRDGSLIRVEHWVVAERQGQVAAANMLGADLPFRDVPFFWSQHYDSAIRHVGHAEGWDEALVSGDISAGDASVSFRRNGLELALATLGRDAEALAARRRLEGLGG